ncbi:MAG TPA: MliC family protein [Candidatus Paceibacterota bacterium]|nr:MliC family protein [Candidatus Paceibacterota bacterium]
MRNTILAIVALIVLAVLVYWFTGFKMPAPSGGQTSSQTATFYCSQDKTIQATFASSSVALVLSDGRSLTLPQAVSGSGARYEATSTAGVDTVFWNEGDNAFLTEGKTNTYDECTAAKVADSDAPGYKTYQDQGDTFTFAFPSDFSVTGTEPGYTPGWSAPATTSGQILAKIYVPQSFEPGTNFGDAWFTVGVSSDPSAVATCLQTLSGAQATTTSSIGGVTFTKILFGGAGAGNRYDTTSYRTVRDNMCYAVEYTVHYGVLENYPKGTVQAFDEPKVAGALDQIAQSFRFLK